MMGGNYWGGGIEIACCVRMKKVNIHVYEVRRRRRRRRHRRRRPQCFRHSSSLGLNKPWCFFVRRFVLRVCTPRCARRTASTRACLQQPHPSEEGTWTRFRLFLFLFFFVFFFRPATDCRVVLPAGAPPLTELKKKAFAV